MSNKEFTFIVKRPGKDDTTAVLVAPEPYTVKDAKAVLVDTNHSFVGTVRDQRQPDKILTGKVKLQPGTVYWLVVTASGADQTGVQARSLSLTCRKETAEAFNRACSFAARLQCCCLPSHMCRSDGRIFES